MHPSEVCRRVEGTARVATGPRDRGGGGMWAPSVERTAAHGARPARHATSVGQGLWVSLGIGTALCATRQYPPHSHPELSRNRLHPVRRSVGPSPTWSVRWTRRSVPN